MAHAGGAHGADAWVLVLERLITQEPEPPDVPTAIGPLAQLGVDVAAVQAVVDRYLGLAEADWHPDDWRRSHPEFPRQYAAVAHVYTHERLGIYRVLGEAMHDVARDMGPGGVSPRMRACLPLVKLLDVGLVEAAILWGFFEGQTHRGVKYAFPRPIVADHDPERHFPAGREFHWFEFNSSATDAQVMYRPHFCGRRGPRTIFQIQSCEGVSVKKFSTIPDEEEVLFRPLARFRVTGCTRMLTEGDLRDDVHPNNGFPDNVQLQQLPTFDPMAVLRAAKKELAAKDAELAEALARIARLEEGIPPARQFVFEGVDNSVPQHGKFDQAGVLNHIGTAGGTREWVNPCRSGDVAVAWSGKENGLEENFVSKWDWRAGGSWTNNQPNSWMRVDLGATRSLAVSHYALRKSGANGGHALRNWELQGANAADGPWTTLRRHDNDASIEHGKPGVGFVAAWAVEGAAPFRFFRIHQHGPNSDNYQYLLCAGIELYGVLTED